MKLSSSNGTNKTLEELEKIEETLLCIKERIPEINHGTYNNSEAVEFNYQTCPDLRKIMEEIRKTLQVIDDILEEKEDIPELVLPKTLEELKDQFDTQEKCRAFEKILEKRQEDDMIHLNDTMQFCGESIRESEKYDGIGNHNSYLLIQIIDMFDTPTFEGIHVFKFLVKRIEDQEVVAWTFHDTIEDAIRSYKYDLSILREEIEIPMEHSLLEELEKKFETKEKTVKFLEEWEEKYPEYKNRNIYRLVLRKSTENDNIGDWTNNIKIALFSEKINDKRNISFYVMFYEKNKEKCLGQFDTMNQAVSKYVDETNLLVNEW